MLTLIFSIPALAFFLVQIWVLRLIVITFLGLVLIGVRTSSNLILECYIKAKNLFRPTLEAPPSVFSKRAVPLDDPIGAIAVVIQRYQTMEDLKDLQYLEIQLFGKASNTNLRLYQDALDDPRPAVIGSVAVKTLLQCAVLIVDLKHRSMWTPAHQELWERKAPKEVRRLLEQKVA